MDNILEDLITEGQKYNFGTNSISQSHGTYSRASVNMLSWVAKVEHFILKNYDENSGPANLFKTFDRSYLNGNTQSDFEKQHAILMGALNSCKEIAPKLKSNPKEDDAILSLLKNKLFWTISVILIGGSFSLGFYFGTSKFDNNLIILSDNNRALKNDIILLKDTLKMRDTVIERIRHISDSALNILGHMPYKEMTLDSLSYRKVQTTIENTGAVWYLIKNYH